MSISRARSAVIGAFVGAPGCCLRPLSLKEPVSTDEMPIVLQRFTVLLTYLHRQRMILPLKTHPRR